MWIDTMDIDLLFYNKKEPPGVKLAFSLLYQTEKTTQVG